MVKTRIYLGEVIKRDGIKFGSNSLIVAPVGSGKSHFIKNDLHDESKTELMLVSTSSLKDSIKFDDGVIITSEMNKRLEENGVRAKGIHLMTYSEFGNLIAFDNKFTEDYSAIYCDEIHSLFDYFSYSKSYALGAAIKFLFQQHEGKSIYYFTATIEKIENFEENVYKGVLDNVETYNYNNDKEIVRHTNMLKSEFIDEYGMMEIIDLLEDFGSNGEKGIIFNERIDGMKRIEGLLEAKGYRTISIWSINNSKHKMSDEQLSVRSELLETGIIPEGYDFLIINGSMREGWNLLDKKVQLAILNTKDKTNQIQARGRIRHNISMVAIRVDGDSLPIDLRIIRREESLRVIQARLGQPLTTEDKSEIVNELGVKRDNGVLVKWNGIKEAIEGNGYRVEDSRKTLGGKLTRVSIITEK